MKTIYEINHYEDLNNEKRIKLDAEFSRIGFVSLENSNKLVISGLVPYFTTNKSIKKLSLTNAEISHIFEIKDSEQSKYLKVNHTLNEIKQNEFDKELRSLCPVIFVDNNKLADEISKKNKYICKGLFVNFEFMANESKIINIKYFIANEDLEAVDLPSDFINEFKISN